MNKIAFVLLSILIFFFVQVTSLFPMGVPTVGSLLGESIAQSLVQDELQRVMGDMSNAGGINSYLKALKKYEKKLKKLRKKYFKQRQKEERTLQRLINDMKSYSRQDAARGEVNRKQEKKQRKLYEYAEMFQENDRRRAREIEQFHDKYYPRMKSY